nr:immunoglobulin heavy chain junction region [Mus musculus]
CTTCYYDYHWFAYW